MRNILEIFKKQAPKLILIIIFLIMKRSQKYYKDQLVYKGQINAQIEETFSRHEIIRTFNQEEKSVERFRGIMKNGIIMNGSHNSIQV